MVLCVGWLVFYWVYFEGSYKMCLMYRWEDILKIEIIMDYVVCLKNKVLVFYNLWRLFKK